MQRKNKRKSFYYFILFIITTFLLILVGLKIFVSMINFFSDINKSDLIKESEDKIPPRMPIVYSISEFTKNKNTEIKGEAEISSIVYLYLNKDKYDVVVGNDGKFIFKEYLNEGNNTFYLKSEDKSGNISLSTKIYHIVFDMTPPILEVYEPNDNSYFYGLKNKIVEIKGKTETECTLSLNDRFVSIIDDGSFIYKYELQDGVNNIKLISKDNAGNETDKYLILNYQN